MKKPIAGTVYTYWGGIAANKERLGHEPNSVTDAKDKYYSGDYAANFARRIAEKRKNYNRDTMT
ncbi:MAG: hypothetical protein RBS37_12185 [Bacteroidales bacterium]|jgi:hypothetical protein|nr:hypothetical protein [Bacteroidales bacterium]